MTSKPRSRKRKPKEQPAPGNRGRWFALASGLIMLAALVVVVSKRDEGLKFADLVRQAHPAWLLVALLLQFGTYMCAAGVWHRVLARQKIHRSLWQLIPLGIAKLFMDQVVPSAGLSGTLLVVRALKRRGVPDGASVSAVVVGMLGFHLAYALALVMALVLLGFSGDLSRKVLLLGVVAALFLGGIMALLAWLSHGKRQGKVRLWLMKLPGVSGFMKAIREAPPEALRDRPLLLQTTLLNLGIFVLDAATLGVCLLAIGATASFGGIFAGFVLASLVATVTIIPSGLGTFDATLIAMLHLVGVPTVAGLGAILLFRGFTLMLSLIPGLWLARREMKGK
jgi:uncharacterized protein (TIRG00374 family)